MNSEFARAVAEARGVLFVCTGNMVRSAFAELYARHIGCPLPVSSAATVFRNDHLLAETARALEERGVPATWTRAFQPRHVDDLLPALDERTLVLAMSRLHLAALAEGRGRWVRAFLLASVLDREEEIADPVLEGADFARTFERVALCVETLVERLRRDRS